MLGIRQQELFDLMDQNEFRSATYFSKQLNVSLKTVRNDIKSLIALCVSMVRKSNPNPIMGIV